MYTIMSTEHCLTAYNMEEKCWEVGNDFTEEEGFDLSTVKWCADAWKDEKEYFSSFLNAQIKDFEKRHHTKVESLSITGRAERWDGRVTTGRLIQVNQNPLEYLGDVNDVEVKVLEDDTIQLWGRHNDGTHQMNLYFLTARKLRELDSEKPEVYSESRYQYIHENFEPLKLTKSGRAYFNPTA